MCTICHTANKAYVKVIEACHKPVFVLSQLTGINTYIKYVTEQSHKKIVNHVKSTLASIVDTEQTQLNKNNPENRPNNIANIGYKLRFQGHNHLKVTLHSGKTNWFYKYELSKL